MLDLHLIDMKSANLTKNPSKTGKTDLKCRILEAQAYIKADRRERNPTSYYFIFSRCNLSKLSSYIRKIPKTAIIIVFIRYDIFFLISNKGFIQKSHKV